MPTGELNPRRFAALDGWRGICAILVALHHFHTTSHVERMALVQHAYLLVDLFFVLSGFVITHAYAERLNSINDAAIMLWRRLARLWPLHAAVLVALIAMELLVPVGVALLGVARGASSSFDPASPMQLTAIPSHLLLLHSLGLHDRLTWNFPSWSISAEFWTYVVFALVTVLARGRMLVASCVLAALGAIVVVMFSNRHMAVDFELGFFRCMCGFFVGSIVYRLMSRMYGLLIWPNVAEVAAVLGVGVFVMYAARGPLEYAAPLVFGFVVWIFAQEQGVVSRLLKTPPLAMLGLLSYSIYMMHSLIIMFIHRAVTVLEQVTDAHLYFHAMVRGGQARFISFGNVWSMDALVAAYALSVVALAYLTWRMIEMPAQRRLNAMISGPRQTVRPAVAVQAV